jgi:hypothetical protein
LARKHLCVTDFDVDASLGFGSLAMVLVWVTRSVTAAELTDSRVAVLATQGVQDVTVGYLTGEAKALDLSGHISTADAVNDLIVRRVLGVDSVGTHHYSNNHIAVLVGMVRF